MIDVLLKDVLNFIGNDLLSVHGNYEEIIIKQPVSILEVNSIQQITFCSKAADQAFELIENIESGTVICKPFDYMRKCELLGKVLICVNNPRLVFLRLVKKFFVNEDVKREFIHDTALIDKTAVIDETAYIGPYVVIGKNCRIGVNVVIEAHSYLHGSVIVGDNVIIHSGGKIGGRGFGYECNENGRWEHFPHLCGVVIGNDVEIGANTCIAWGALSDTIIGEGTKIGDSVHIGHNVVIGSNCIIAAAACICGSVKIGDSSWIAPHAVIRDVISIGSNVVVGLGAVVIRNVKDSVVLLGNPAHVIRSKK